MQPIAELTKFGWFLMSPGQKDLGKMYLARSTPQDYDRLCNIDVLGIKEPSKDETVMTDFKEQLKRKDNR